MPTWDGSARSWRRYTPEVSWFVRSTPYHKRRYCATKLVSQLSGPARLLAMSWRNADFDNVGGTKLYLQRLATSPLVRQSLPNAAAICQQYFAFRREHGEAMHAFLVREALGYSEFIEALERLKDDKMGIEQHEKDFDLPEEYVTDEAEPGEDQPDPDDDDDREARARPPSSPTTRPAAGDTDGSVGSPLRPPPRSTPSRHSAAVGPDDPGFSLADSFVLGVLRGFRPLQAAGLNADEKRDIVSATRGSLEFEVIVKDEQLLGRPGGWLQDYAAETDWDSWTDPNYDQYYGYGDIPEEPEPSEAQAHQVQGDDPADPQLQEAQAAERMAENLAMEAQRTWTEAQ